MLGSRHVATLSLEIFQTEECLPNVTIWQHGQRAAGAGLHRRSGEALAPLSQFQSSHGTLRAGVSAGRKGNGTGRYRQRWQNFLCSGRPSSPCPRHRGGDASHILWKANLEVGLCLINGSLFLGRLTCTADFPIQTPRTHLVTFPDSHHPFSKELAGCPRSVPCKTQPKSYGRLHSPLWAPAFLYQELSV